MNETTTKAVGEDTPMGPQSGVNRPLARVFAGNERGIVEDAAGRRAHLRDQSAVVLHALVRRGGSAHWTDVVVDLWGRAGLQRRDDFDKNVMFRLRLALRQAGIADNLVRRRQGRLWFADGVEAAPLP